MQSQDFRPGDKFRLKQYIGQHYEIVSVNDNFISYVDMNESKREVPEEHRRIFNAFNCSLEAFTDAGQIVMDEEVIEAVAAAESRMEQMPYGEIFKIESLFEEGVYAS